MGPAPGNWRGHFEDSDFYQLQEEMLAAGGVTALTADDDFVLTEDFTYQVEVRFFSGRSCEEWTLSFTGYVCD